MTMDIHEYEEALAREVHRQYEDRPAFERRLIRLAYAQLPGEIVRTAILVSLMLAAVMLTRNPALAVVCIAFAVAFTAFLVERVRVGRILRLADLDLPALPLHDDDPQEPR